MLNAISGAVSMVLSNICWHLLPLTVFFVILCSLPFVLGIISYFLLGEKMTFASIIAAVISFFAIIVLSMAKPEEDGVDAEEANHNYVLGVICAVINMLAISCVVLTTRMMQGVPPNLILEFYNVISAVLIGLYILIRWPITGEVPLEMDWTAASAAMLIGACFAHLGAQVLMFYVNQVAQPALVALLSYFGIVLRVLTDLVIFDIRLNRMQMIAIFILVIVQVAHLVYKQMSQHNQQKAADVSFSIPSQTDAPSHHDSHTHDSFIRCSQK